MTAILRLMEAPWLNLLRAAASHDEGRPLILALATVDAAGNPQVRSMICRCLDEDGRLWLTTDSRSAKHAELSLRSNAAAAAWFPATREQFRFEGRVEMLGESSVGLERAKVWRTLTAETRATFQWPRPGEPRASDGEFVKSNEALDPPASFGVLLLRPEKVEHLNLKTHPHQRRCWRRDGQWSVRELNP